MMDGHTSKNPSQPTGVKCIPTQGMMTRKRARENALNQSREEDPNSLQMEKDQKDDLGDPAETKSMNSPAPTFKSLPNEMKFRILSNLDHRSLLSCRQVSQSWCEVSSTIIQSRLTSVVHFRRPSNKTMDTFFECFKESQKFHHIFTCVNFEFGGTDEEACDLKPLLSLLKKQSDSSLLIKSLRLNKLDSDQPTKKDLERLMLDPTITSQLEILSLHFDCRRSQNASQPFDDSIQLPSLKVLQVHKCSSPAAVNFVTHVVRAAPNLQRIEGTHNSGFKGSPYHISYPGHLKLLITSEKLHLIQQCEIQLLNPFVSATILSGKKLQGFQPTWLQLELRSRYTNQMIFSEFWNRDPVLLEKTLPAVREILWAVKDIVEELRTDDSFGVLDTGKNFPRFSKLKRLHWNLDGRAEFPIFPAGIRGRGVFPNLQEIRITLRDNRGQGGDQLLTLELNSIPVISSVRRLKIKTSCPLTGACLNTLGIMCPNIESLDFSYYSLDLSIVAPLIWRNMSQLQTLVLNNEDDRSSTRQDSLEKMEAGFTGFTLDTVRQLRAAAPEDWPKMEEMENLRINPSICQMKELKKLVIKRMDANGIRAADLPLALKYAFDVMPELIVEI